MFGHVNECFVYFFKIHGSITLVRQDKKHDFQLFSHVAKQGLTLTLSHSFS